MLTLGIDPGITGARERAPAARGFASAETQYEAWLRGDETAA